MDALFHRMNSVPHQAAEEPDDGVGECIRLWAMKVGWCVGRLWDLMSLLVLLSVFSAIPVVQFAALGYILRGAGNLASGRVWPAALPGLSIAGRFGMFATLASVAWLPVWLIADLAYSAQLLEPGSRAAAAWRFVAFCASGGWVVYVTWCAVRGGRWWHFLWPAPILFIQRVWRPSTWSDASERLYQWITSLQFPTLWWLGARATAGALLWTALPVTMMIIGQRVSAPGVGLIGLIGALLMMGVFLYLPFLQIQLAITNRFLAMFDVVKVRKEFRFAPLAYALGLMALGLLSIPLYLLRIEMPPRELQWMISLVFVLFSLPCKLVLGVAIGYGLRRRAILQGKPRHWTFRWTGRLLGVASALIYVGALYFGQLIANQGALGMYFQHAFLTPAPM